MKFSYTRTGLVLCVFSALVFANACDSTDNDDDTATTALTALLAASVNLPIEIIGTHQFFDGTNGTSNNGSYVITNTSRSQTFTGFTPTTGTVVNFSNARRVFFEQVTSTSSNGKFLWYRWTRGTDGKYYICPDLNGAANTLAESQAEFTAVEASPGTTADPNNLGTSTTFTGGGCGGFFWSRLERVN